MKLNRKSLRKLILKEMAGMGGTMPPSHEKYDAVGEAIMQSYRVYAGNPNLAMMVQYMPSVINDIYQTCAENCEAYGCRGHETYVYEKVMQKLGIPLG
jgi:hypothetical protein